NPDMTIVGLRYFNVYGPREYYKGHAASMMFQLYNQMKQGKKPRIFKHGEQQRDFVYVKDVVSANLLAAQAEESCVVNVGTGKPEDFNAVIACLNKELGTNLETEYFDNPYNFYQMKTQASTGEADLRIGYKAQFSLSQGIEDYVKILEGK
ncbi:MAG: NAD-dependent epimerase/dehydratase family protein, partial [Elusimicrobiaceae bacterium]